MQLYDRSRTIFVNRIFHDKKQESELINICGVLFLLINSDLDRTDRFRFVYILSQLCFTCRDIPISDLLYQTVEQIDLTHSSTGPLSDTHNSREQSL